MKRLLASVILFSTVSACGSSVGGAGQAGSASAASDAVTAVPEPKTAVPQIVAEYPHDAKAYTQGLLWADGGFYESTGEYGESSLRFVEPATGKVGRKVTLPERYFGEGLALVGDSLLYQLTWQEQRCFVYRKSDFRQVGVFAYSGEGWGLTSDRTGDSLYMSDGSSWVRVLDPADFSQRRRFQVRDHNGPVTEINELEWIGDRLWANLYLTDRIAVIDPATGYVTHYIDCSALETRIAHRRGTDVLNGIAHDPATGRIFLTGKNWDKLFEIEVGL
ncbi:glutaminyl-peptide cyclotransferase [uncultured Rikenella sp.]|uniref:glutaminyl-peptide cyclotransferase n=1 Tax=uncultured Rikenella sp. TaxID=368003 RepID=UPI00260AAB81|nr:glutaminyl-peptide cyclotransferase [uncultured Rikenella sp.]